MLTAQIEILEKDLAILEKKNRLLNGMRSAEETVEEIVENLRAFRRFNKFNDSRWLQHLQERIAKDDEGFLSAVETPLDSPSSTASLEQNIDKRIKQVELELEFERQRLEELFGDRPPQLVQALPAPSLHEKVKNLALEWQERKRNWNQDIH